MSPDQLADTFPRMEARDLRLQIMYVPPESLVPFPANPRKIEDAERENLKRILATHGMVEPIIARLEDNLIIGGHRRREILMEWEWPKVPTVFLEGVSDQEAAALNIALNNPDAMGDWDMAILTEVLSELDAHGFDVEAGTGFDQGALERLLTWSSDRTDEEKKEMSEGARSVTCPSCGNVFELWPEL